MGLCCLTTKSKNSAIVTLLILSVYGCSSAVMRPINESKKDQSGTYDGVWAATALESPGLQYGSGNWVFHCENKPGKFAEFVVEDGVARLNFKSKTHETFVGQSGEFRFEVPLTVTAKTAGTSDSSITQGDMTMIVFGSLKNNKGYLTWGIAEFANNGCTSKLTFAKS